MRRSGSGTFILYLVCALILLCIRDAAFAETIPAAPSTGNVVTLNFNAAVLGTIEAQRRLGALEKKYSPREQQLHRLSDDIEALRRPLNDSSAKLGDEEKSHKLQELGAKEKQLQREAEDIKNESQSDSQQAFQQVAQKVFSFLQSFSQQHGYAAVLERGTDTAPIVWYAASNVDITDQITKGYDAKSGLSATALPETPARTQSAPATSP